MPRSWSDALLAWLHDPPDKALSIVDHVSRARRYAAAALDDEITESDMQILSDSLASASERLPMPDGRGDDAAERRVGAEALRVVHPLSAAPREIAALAIEEGPLEACIRRIVAELPDAERPQRFLALWRLLPDRLADVRAEYALLPADTRTPDHTIWQHLDITAALAAGDWGGNAAFLSFSLGPVQSFIAAARSLRDLWTGSMILSWLTFQAMLPLIEELGPTALVYPSLRGVPFLDRWLRKKHGLRAIDEPSAELSRAPCLPNRFVAVVPWGVEGTQAVALAEATRQAARQAWDKVCDKVRARLDGKLKSIDPGWDRLWRDQASDYFEIRTALLPWNECDDNRLGDLLRGKPDFDEAFPRAARVRGLASAVARELQPGGHPQATAGQWQHRLELSARLMEAAKSVRHSPQATVAVADENVPPKCSQLGSLEQMGPAKLAASAEFWQQAAEVIAVDGVRLRSNERFCAVALVKRFAGPAFFTQELQLDRGDLRLQDTATVAAGRWLKGAGIDPEKIRAEHDKKWSGQWLHWSSREQEPDDGCPETVRDDLREARRNSGAPPTYYAVLMVDGDNLGDWLRGELSPSVEQVMHEKMVGWYRGQRQSDAAGLRAAIDAGLAAPRPVGPALHAALSEALANFALHFVPPIVDKHGGELIYAGGDDVLALLPTSTALACARELSDTFRENWKSDAKGRQRMLMGTRATLSAGLAVVHYKEDLRFALGQARQAEKAAKTAGRNALQIAVCRRSGEHATALCPWEFAETVQHWVHAFLPQNGSPGASDRWAYHLRQELDTLCGLPPEAMQAEIKRQLGRAEEATRRRFSATDPKKAAHDMATAFDTYRDSKKPAGSDGGPNGHRFQTD
ncbi:MAG TPA: type III-B CRISPR-associated protein Cas10/Cmr2, partial [Pirellulales bacterium]|nr:type III-B CRISPR-associated protein Cas10/Cmr2 [Pirellulales bacterium]